MPKSLDALLNDFFTEAVAQENTFAEPQRIPLVVQRFDVQGGIGAGHGETHGVGAGVNRGDVNQLRHRGSLPPEVRERGGRRVLCAANAELLADALAQLLIYRGDAGFAVELDEIVTL